MYMDKYFKKILVLAVLLPFFIYNIAIAANTAKTVIARVSKADGSSFPSNADITITAKNGHSQTATYSSGTDPDGIITGYNQSNGNIQIEMGNFDNQWEEGEHLTIGVLNGVQGNLGYEEGGTTTTLDANDPQSYTTDANLDFQLTSTTTTTTTLAPTTTTTTTLAPTTTTTLAPTSTTTTLAPTTTTTTLAPTTTTTLPPGVTTTTLPPTTTTTTTTTTTLPQDLCPNDPNKTAPGECGCGVADIDADNDTIIDCVDNCPNAANQDQADADADGAGDACDVCPNDPDKIAEGDCGCGRSEADTDEDGIKDCNDNAPYTPNAGQEDEDEDGVGDAAEKGPSGDDDNYDGNNDDKPDWDQNHVASLPANYGQDYVTLSTGEECSLADVKNLPIDEAENLPEGIDFPYGLFEFGVLDCLANLDPGSAVAVTIDLPEDVNQPQGETINTYYKFGPTPDNAEFHWYEFLWDGETGVEEIIGNAIVIYFIDGQRGDDDLDVNGIIIDQGGPAFAEGGSGGGGGGGCFIETLFSTVNKTK